MSGNSTILSIGGVSISTSGYLTGLLLDDLTSVLAAASTMSNYNLVTIAAGGSIPAAVPGDYNVLVLPPGETGEVNAPGYQVIVNGSTTDSINATGGQIVVGDLNMIGYAGTVIATGSVGGTVADGTAGAALAFDGGFNLVYGLAAGQTFRFDAGLNTLVATGMGDVVSVDGSASVIGYMNAGSNWDQFGAASFTTIISGGAASNDYTISAGSAVIYASNTGDSLFASGSSSVDFANALGVSTVFGDGAANTVFANGGVLYEGTGGANSLFIGGSGFSTVWASSNEVAYGGSGGEQIILSQGDTLLFVGGDGSDTINGGADSVAPTVWGNDGNNLTVVSSAPGALYVLYGATDKMNLMFAGGSSHILGVDGGAFAGNDSLTMSNAGNDSLVLFAGSIYGLQTGDHTITVMNWQSNDVMDLSDGYASSDAANAQAALAGGASSFTLADGTTVQFIGNKPSSVIHV